MHELGDIRAWCENNKGTCAGLICVLILLILVVSTGKSCSKLNLRFIFHDGLL